MAQASPTSGQGSSNFEAIKILHRTSTTLLIPFNALKSDAEKCTVTKRRATSLGLQVSSNNEESEFVLRWRLVTFNKVWWDTFKIVNDPTTVDGVEYDVVLSANASERTLRAKSGAFVALGKSKTKEERKRERQEDEKEKDQVEKELEEERRRRREKWEKQLSPKQQAVATS